MMHSANEDCLKEIDKLKIKEFITQKYGTHLGQRGHQILRTSNEIFCNGSKMNHSNIIPFKKPVNYLLIISVHLLETVLKVYVLIN